MKCPDLLQQCDPAGPFDVGAEYPAVKLPRKCDSLMIMTFAIHKWGLGRPHCRQCRHIDKLSIHKRPIPASLASKSQ